VVELPPPLEGGFDGALKVDFGDGVFLRAAGPLPWPRPAIVRGVIEERKRFSSGGSRKKSDPSVAQVCHHG